jgi:branched-chain amino acid transport system permease protein
MKKSNHWSWWALLAFTTVLPLFITGTYHRHLMVMAAISIIMASGLNLIVGFMGELSLGHSAYFGIGAYASTLVVMKLGMPVWIGFAMAGVIGGIFGFLIGYPSLRLRGPYFAISTLGFVMILHLIVINWEALTNGPMGIVGIPPAAISLPFLKFKFTSKVSYYYLVLAFTWAVLFVIHRIINSRMGRAFLACRENEELARSVGIHVFRFHLVAFIIGTCFISLAGGLYAHYISFLDPEVFTWYYIVTMLIMVLIGGPGTIAGPVIGAILFTWLPEYLRAVKSFQMVFYGLILVVAIIFMPEGIYGSMKQFYSQRIGRERAPS